MKWKAKVARDRLKWLAADMRKVANALETLERDDTDAHATELSGAAEMVDTWIAGLEVS